MSNCTQNSLFASLDQFVVTNHPCLDALISFTWLAEPLQVLYSEKGRKEKGAEFALRCLFL